MSDICPCKGCVERYPGCHDHCTDKYLPWKRREAIRKANPEEKVRQEYNKYTTSVIAKTEKIKRHHKSYINS